MYNKRDDKKGRIDPYFHGLTDDRKIIYEINRDHRKEEQHDQCE